MPSFSLKKHTQQIALLMNNLHNIKFTHFKCTIQQFLVNLEQCATNDHNPLS